jgi:hypothetical protein
VNTPIMEKVVQDVADNAGESFDWSLAQFANNITLMQIWSNRHAGTARAPGLLTKGACVRIGSLNLPGRVLTDRLGGASTCVRHS